MQRESGPMHGSSGSAERKRWARLERRRGLALMVLGALGASPAATHAGAAAASASYRLPVLTIDATGGAASATGVAVTAAVGQASTVETSASGHYIVQMGSFSYVGSSLRPIVLSLAPDADEPGQLDLNWTGTNPPYTIFRSSACDDVFATPLLTQASNAYADAAAPPAPLVCYNVLGTPGENCATCGGACGPCICGNGIVESPGGEECDGPNLNGSSCQALGFSSGALACDASCRFDTTGCSNF